MAKVTKKKPSGKPAKPYADFPLFPHATKRWAKKIKGNLYYFGPWSDPKGSLEKYQEQRDDLYAGRKPRKERAGLTVEVLANAFLTAKRHLVDTRELSPRTWAEYLAVCKTVADFFGRNRLVEDLAADDFERLRAALAKGRNPVTLGNTIQRIRVIFKYAYDSNLIASQVRYGQQFKRPTKSVLRRTRQAKGLRMFEADAIGKIVKAASPQMKAMILLGINCGLGNRDVATLPVAAIKGEYLDFPRPKTGIERRAWLWPETRAAIADAIKDRPSPKHPAHAGLVFLTRCGEPWWNEVEIPERDSEAGGKSELSSTATSTVNIADPVSQAFGKVIRKLSLHRPGLGFYALRHSFETIAGESRDQVAVDHVMGHSRPDMASVYRQRISDERIKAVCEHVRGWLYPPTDEATQELKSA